MIRWWATSFGEAEKKAVCDAIDGKHISQGAITRQFEDALAERLGVPYVCCTSSGTTALTLALMSLRHPPGIECWLPDRTWIATAHAAMMAGYRVRLVDVMPSAPVMDCGAVPAEANVGIPVNLNGRMTDLANLTTCWIVEDSCQAFPNPPQAGVDIACYSLSVAKIISTGQGGFCATRDEALYREMLALRTQGVADPNGLCRWERSGFNFRFTDLQASIGLVQLKRLDDRLAALAEIHALYKELGVPVLETPTPLYNELLHVEPERLRLHLSEHGIEARPFYPALHTAPYLMAAGKFPNADKFSSGLFLPSGSNQRISDIRRVCEVINDFR